MNESKIFEYKKQIAELLFDRPEYAAYQKAIEDKLRSAGNSHNRMVLLGNMMADKVNELSVAMEELSKALK